MASRRVSMEDYVKSHGGLRVIRRILLANNGMAATKAIMSMRNWAFMELGSTQELEIIVMASKDDLEANAEFIRLANAFVEVPGGKNSNNYANVPLICEIAQSQKVDAVWPGWGHASENPALPRTLHSMGIGFLGPTDTAMYVLGDKIASTILAQTAGVPCIPWNGEGIQAKMQADGNIDEETFKKACLQNCDEAIACANRIGYPIVLKASEGGGGKGIRKCKSDEELRAAWDQVTMEVVGSPIFMMQLCTRARHLEVQLVGDEHGNVVSLSGRDCSTQRRFQKIFEEGPPVIAKRESFREAEKSAQRLAMSVGYRGAGTVEYLYSPENDKFSFLELNPRLQVEHPVTEGITGVNVPALQLQIAMGIPLYRVPDIRRFYNMDPAGTEAIDFLKTDYPYPNCHVIAARVTAENPDDGFRPTSGRVERVRFQSSPSAWGYFSVGANGQIHEFADSQFGHIFAKGPNREEARKTLQVALENLLIAGEIRNPVEYLVELAETPEFRQNTIDTAWLDKLIADKTVISSKFHKEDSIFFAACFRAHSHVQAKKKKVLEGIRRGHAPLKNDLSLMQDFVVEVAHEQIKYIWQVSRLGPDRYALSIGGTGKNIFEVKIREQPDGSLYVILDQRSVQVTGFEEPLGLRLRIEGGSTIAFPHVRDPSELRSDFNGKLVRYLKADGEDVAEGEFFVELEAMKMIMSLKASAAGKIHHALAPGAIVSAGQLLANLDLADPSSVQTVKPFAGVYVLSGVDGDDDEPGSPKLVAQSSILDMPMDDVSEIIMAHLDGYLLSPGLKGGGSATKLVSRLLPTGDEIDEVVKAKALECCDKMVGKFLDNERFHAGLVGGNETEVIRRFAGEAEDLLKLIVAHDSLDKTVEVMATLLRCLTALAETDEQFRPDEPLRKKLEEVSKLPLEGGYGSAAVLAKRLLEANWSPFEESREFIRTQLQTLKVDSVKTFASKEGSALGASAFGIDGLATMFSDEDSGIRMKAVEVFIRRLHRGYPVADFEFFTAAPDSCLHAVWTYALQGLTQATQTAYSVVVPSIDAYAALKQNWEVLAGQKPATLAANAPIHSIHLFVAKTTYPEMKDPKMHEQAFAKMIEDTSALIQAVAPMLDKRGCNAVHVVLCRENRRPSFLHFLKSSDWKEKKELRFLRSCYPALLEVADLDADYTLDNVFNSRCHQVWYGTPKQATAKDMLFARSVSYRGIDVNTLESVMMQELLSNLDSLDRVNIDPSVEKRRPASSIMIHLVSPMEGGTDRDLKLLRSLMKRVVHTLVNESGARLLKLRLEKIEFKVWATETVCVRLVASSMFDWEVRGFQETLDGKTGKAVSWQDVDTAEVTSDISVITPLEAKLHAKRNAARNAGSTYIYDFLGIFRNAITRSWYHAGMASKMPELTFEYTELVLEGDELKEVKRPAGENKVAMVAFLCTLKSPEYPSGRNIIIVANDVTLKSGSFGTVEDDVFHKASELARKRGIPRIYIACNSGARIGGVEELKANIEVAWVDPQDLNKGYDYLYLSDATLKGLPAEAVKSHPMTVNGETRHVLDAIVGTGLPSVNGGIGVENLHGSGLIAGETVRAYEETFTLSYVSGRSVGIGAYLNRLGIRVIQMIKGPMILTGYQALNKLLGQQVYTTQDQLGGPHIMVPNGVTHELVRNDRAGVEAILKWLSFVPKDTASLPPLISPIDPLTRQIKFFPPSAPYDPRHMLAGVRVDGEWQGGFCDEGSFHEYMEGWGKTVVVGRGRVGGLPIGIIAVETRAVERHIPADPANPTSQDIKEAQAGQVFYPDSSYKMAQAIRDFNRGENLPLVVFANWRGFSGGTRDMFAEVLKYGSMIVDALVEYKHPIMIYIPPNGELRGGAWVVLAPSINPEQMEMFADVESRGGILEPPAAAEICFKDRQLVEMMHRCDSTLQKLDADKTSGKSVDKDIKAREKLLMPFYRQVSRTYCDLHDRSGRMVAVGAISDELTWKDSREYLHWRIRRRLRQLEVSRKLQAQVEGLSSKEAADFAAALCKDAGISGDKATAEWLESRTQEVDAKIEEKRQQLAEDKIYDLIRALPSDKRKEVVRDLLGYSKVLDKQGS